MVYSNKRTYFLLVLLGCVSVVAFLVLKPFLTTIVLAAVFAVLLYPLYRRLKVLVRLPSIAGILTILLGTVVALIPFVYIGSLVVSEARHAYVSITTSQNVITTDQLTVSIATWLEPNFPDATNYAHSVSTQLNTYVTQGLEWLLQKLGDVFTSIPALLLYFVIFYMTLYYFLKEGPTIKKFLIGSSPLKKEEAETILKQLSHTINSITKGSLVIACVHGILAGIGYALFNVPNPALWGVVTAIAALIPGIGASLILIPVFLYLLLFGTLGEAIGFGFWGVLVVGPIDYFLAPLLMSRGISLPPLFILLSMLGGIILFGPVGIFMGPLTISLLFTLYNLYVGHTHDSL